MEMVSPNDLSFTFYTIFFTRFKAINDKVIITQHSGWVLRIKKQDGSILKKVVKNYTLSAKYFLKKP